MYQTISYERPGRTRNKDGALLPTGLTVTYNLNVPDFVALQHFPEYEPGDDTVFLETLNDGQKETLAADLIRTGATFATADQGAPGYVVEDKATGWKHWQFWQNGSRIARMTRDENGAIEAYTAGTEHDQPKDRLLSAAETQFCVERMAATQDGRFPTIVSKPVTEDYLP